ncbi:MULTISPECIES: NUDIX domain-containing protein [Alphaproteobacteria]|uniref:NUDIX hydrolase n=2 Tax=Alphaproteobacteria TaxID=28211 RepID=A0A512HF28_9HYPH|nr:MULTISPECIES: NUDIX domain-containing protein [Alphaproteobacteria]GEO83970.1 NUDIX hydrolase [Ciceribacter naphthalenivorans]GLR21152.1 NUDIX hydrolase [Ciceribacter naphthalenivorans]GLT04008.1 NUDIX hydrolase [Sphingomonas psychrolutea]
MSQQSGLDERNGLARRMLLKVLHGYFAMSRGMTLGVRAACFNAEGQIFLVRHSYVPGWYMPGGGVERNETAFQALEKELREEGNLELTAPPQLFHVYFNRRISPRDHVLLYRAQVLQTAPRLADREIVEAGFFDPRDLPKDVTSATLCRLRELGGEVSPADFW